MGRSGDRVNWAGRRVPRPQRWSSPMPNPTQPFMPAAVFVALDLSRTSWVVALRTSGDDRVSTHKLRPGDVDRLLDLIERARAREEQRPGRGAVLLRGRLRRLLAPSPPPGGRRA